jgi:hypothetical protein
VGLPPHKPKQHQAGLVPAKFGLRDQKRASSSRRNSKLETVPQTDIRPRVRRSFTEMD